MVKIIGIGLLVIEAAIMAKEGKTAEEIEKRMQKLMSLVSMIKNTKFFVQLFRFAHL